LDKKGAVHWDSKNETVLPQGGDWAGVMWGWEKGNWRPWRRAGLRRGKYQHSLEKKGEKWTLSMWETGAIGNPDEKKKTVTSVEMVDPWQNPPSLPSSQ